MIKNGKMTLLIHIVLTLFTILAVLPFILMFMSSITDESMIFQNGYSFIPGQYMKMKNYQNLLSEEEFRDKTLRFEEDYKILCQKEKESDSTIFSILAQVRSNIC